MVWLTLVPVAAKAIINIPLIKLNILKRESAQRDITEFTNFSLISSHRQQYSQSIKTNTLCRAVDMELSKPKLEIFGLFMGSLYDSVDAQD